MRAGGGKEKGGRFEREVCQELSLWISEGKRTDIFWRSAMSGGRATIGLREGLKRSSQAGDISAIVALGERLLNLVVVECKTYLDLDIPGALLKDTGRLSQFWQVVSEQAKEFDRAPFLISHQNKFPTFCLFPERLFPIFGLSPIYTRMLLPRWDAACVLFDVFLREAKVPEADVCYPQASKRVRLKHLLK